MQRGRAGKKILIIGGVACGPKAAARARRCDPEAEITVIERGPFFSYAGCGLPFFVAGAVRDISGLLTTPAGLLRDRDYFRQVKDVLIRPNTEAEGVDRSTRTVQVVDRETGNRETLDYDQMVLATGARPIIPRLEGVGLDGVFNLRSPSDALQLRQRIDAGEVDHVTLIGGGRVALEVADALMAQAVEATIVEIADHLLPAVLDAEMTEPLEKALVSQGIEVQTSTRALRIEGNEAGKAQAVVTSNGTVPTDLVLLAVGVRPNVELAVESGLALGETGAIAVNERLQTSDPNIYAGGDCVECRHLVSGQPVFAPLGSVANRHGRVIGTNITGGEERFPGVVGTTILKSIGLNIAKTGFSQSEAEALGYRVLTARTPASDRSHFYPGGRTMRLKLIADAEDGRLLGCQIMGTGDVSKPIDTLATALHFKASVQDVAMLDLSYAPPFATALSNVAQAANLVRNKREGRAQTLTSAEVTQKIDRGDPFIFLDVRSVQEIENSPLEDSRVRAIPLNELRERAAEELPRNEEIICLCPQGIRAYEACRILNAAGFQDVKFLEGGLGFWERDPRGEH